MMRRTSCRWLAALCFALTFIAPLLAHAEEEILPVGRVSLGAAAHVVPEAEPKAGFVVDARAGFVLFFEGADTRPGVVWNVEAGYGHDTLRPLHAAQLTTGIGYGNVDVGIRYSPMGLVGTLAGNVAGGMRNSLTAFFLADIVTLEAGHQFLYDGRTFHHDLQVVASVNVAGGLWLLVRPFVVTRYH